MKNVLTLGERIDDLMKEKGITNAQLAAEIGTEPGNLSKIRNGTNNNPKSELIVKLAKFFDVTSDYILGLENCKTHVAADIGNVTGLSDEAIHILKRMNKPDTDNAGDSVLLYCLNKIIENFELRNFLQEVDQYTWAECVKSDCETIMLKDFIKENNLNISLAEIKARGKHALSYDQRIKFESYIWKHKLQRVFLLNDHNSSQYRLQKSLSDLMFMLTGAIIFDGKYYNTANVDYSRQDSPLYYSNLSPYRQAQLKAKQCIKKEVENDGNDKKTW